MHGTRMAGYNTNKEAEHKSC